MNNSPQITLSIGTFENQQVIFLDFEFNWNIVDRLQNYSKANYIPSVKRWYIEREIFNLIELNQFIGEGIAINDTAFELNKKPISPDEYEAVLRRKRYSENTISTYLSYFEDFQKHFSNTDLNEILPAEINVYILQLIKEKDISNSQQNQRINAIKFWYEKVLGREKQYYSIERPRKERKLPDILDKTEVQKIINSTENLKHKSILAVIYSAGLRRSELLNLKKEHIDSKRMLIKISAGKGKKDRYTTLSLKLLQLLREYYKQYQPNNWLFEGPNGNAYSATSISKILKRSAVKAGIKKRVHPHMLRHSFATHLLEQGTNLRLIQEILGHDSIKTTEIYTHISNTEIQNIKNPLDDLF